MFGLEFRWKSGDTILIPGFSWAAGFFWAEGAAEFALDLGVEFRVEFRWNSGDTILIPGFSWAAGFFWAEGAAEFALDFGEKRVAPQYPARALVAAEQFAVFRVGRHREKRSPVANPREK